MNRQQLLSRLARRGWEVIYSTGALSVWERHTERWHSSPLFDTFVTLDGVKVIRPGRLFARWPSCRPYDAAMIRWHARVLATRARSSGSRKMLAYVFHPNYLSHAQGLGAELLVYHAYDAFSATPGTPDALASAEKELVQKADLIIGSSASILRLLPSPGPIRGIVLENGADNVAFMEGVNASCPADLDAIPHPRIGYVGRLTPKVDFRIISAVAKERPDWHWVMVGPILDSGSSAVTLDPIIGEAYCQTRQMPNVHFLGPKHHKDLPAYVGHMDVNTMVYRMDEGWWTAGYPLKMHEYLASGRPVVSTALPEICRFSEVIDLVTDTESWIAAIERALAGGVGSVELRQAMAAANSWEARATVLEGKLLEIIQRASI